MVLVGGMGDVVWRWTVFGAVTIRYLLRHDPALLAERLKLVPVSRDQKPWDRAIMTLFFAASVTLLIVPGLDVARYGRSACRYPVAVADGHCDRKVEFRSSPASLPR